MKILAPYLSCLPASDDPLSADVFVIRGERRDYVFDVGNCEEALAVLRALPREKAAILSHFHPDHTGNIGRLEWAAVYAGGLTQKKIGRGQVVQDTEIIRDGVEIVIRHVASPHAKGSLIATINGEYTLLGDLWYHRPDYDREAARQMLLTLRTIDTRYFVASHQAQNVREKDALLAELTAHFEGDAQP